MCHLQRCLPLCCLLLSLAVCGLCDTFNNSTSPREWPDQFHAKFLQARDNRFALVDLWYDWRKGGNFLKINNQLGEILYDLEWTNGTSFYWRPTSESCKVISFPVGILRPDWLNNATYLGEQKVNGFICSVWEKAEFITYWEAVDTGFPVKWTFFDGATFQVMIWEEGVTLDEERWQAPSYCFQERQMMDNPGEGWQDDWHPVDEEVPASFRSAVHPLESQTV